MSHERDPRRTEEGFEAIVPAGRIEEALSVLDALVEECVIELREEGMGVAAVDPATVGFVELHLEASAFASYEASGGVMGVDLARLLAAVELADADSPLRLVLDPEVRTLRVEAAGLEYTLALLDPETIRNAPDRAELDADATAGATMGVEQLRRAVRACEMVSDHLAIGAEGDVMYVAAEGDTDDVRLELGDEDLREFSPGEAHSLFSLDYLSAMVSAIPPGTEIEACFGTETILELAFEVADGEGEAAYLLSPRMQV